MSAKGVVLRWLGGVLLREGRVDAVEAYGDLRLLVLALPAPLGGRPGDKLQCLLPGDHTRTYTPIGDGVAPRLLVHLHGDAPGARWAAAARPGDRIRFLPPQRSLRLPDGPVVLLGDETSVALTAAAQRSRGDVRAVFAARADLAPALAAAGVRGAVAVPAGDDDAAVDAVASAVAGRRGVVLGLTGSGEVIARIRPRLRPLVDARPVVKTYWLAGRTGLD